MILVESLNSRDGKVKRNPKLVEESEIEEVRLFDKSNF